MKLWYLSLIVFLCLVIMFSGNVGLGDVNTNPPSSPVKLIFIHHSVGEAWLSDDNGGLAKELGQNN